MKKSIIDLYIEYSSKTGDRLGPISVVTKKYSVGRALYPGSYIHITPSILIPEVVYVDTDKKAKQFFRNLAEIEQYINKKKRYTEKAKIGFQGVDFTKPLQYEDNYFDLMISLYAGFISQACKRYLKVGGLLLVNDSHGDATRAYLDKEYEFIGVVIYSKGSYKVDYSNNEKYFRMKGNKPIPIDIVCEKMKGPKYVCQTEYYLFKKTG